MVKTADTTKIANVYVYAIPKTPNFSSLYPAERQREIESTLNMKVKEEKYYAWKVLEYALDKTFGYKIEDFAFSKTQYGKWETCGVYFSISHSHRVVAVAVSNEPIGVDIELVKQLKTNAIERVLVDEELKLLTKVNAEAKTQFLLNVWSKKESAFKRDGVGAFNPSKIDVTKYNYFEKVVNCNNEKYVLNVCSNQNNLVKIYSDFSLS